MEDILFNKVNRPNAVEGTHLFTAQQVESMRLFWNSCSLEVNPLNLGGHHLQLQLTFILILLIKLNLIQSEHGDVQLLLINTELFLIW